jgi:hypothetical protein
MDQPPDSKLDADLAHRYTGQRDVLDVTTAHANNRHAAAR